ncbi:hypothetical protein BST61_g9841 [Cercospora zeina]
MDVPNAHGKRPAGLEAATQGSPKGTKTGDDHHLEKIFRGAEIENLLWYTAEETLQIYHDDYVGSAQNNELTKAHAFQWRSEASKIHIICPELEGLLPDKDATRGRDGNMYDHWPSYEVSAALQRVPDWETHTSQRQLPLSSYSNSFSRTNKLWKNGIPSAHAPPQSGPKLRWVDMAFYDWANPLFTGNTKARIPVQPTKGGIERKARPAPDWFLTRSAATSPDTKTVADYCLKTFGIDELPVWPNIITFPAGSYCHRMFLGTASSAEVAQFLITRRWVVGHRVFLSATIYAISDDKKHEAPNVLWHAIPYHPAFKQMRDANGATAFPATPDGYPHMWKPKPRLNPA